MAKLHLHWLPDAEALPLDGEREWTYLNDAEDVGNPMRVEKVATPVMKDETAVYTLEYYNEETGDIAR